MRRMLLGLCLFLAACGADPAAGPEPEALALVDEPAAVDVAPGTDLMAFTIGRQSFELNAGICNTYDDGTFKFALAEGTIDSGGHVTATIERFDTGVGFEMIIALEGAREDGTAVSWYAQESIDVHNIASTVLGGTSEGTALFASDGGPEAAGVRADGSFAVSCG